jgi:hypothetical protein
MHPSMACLDILEPLFLLSFSSFHTLLNRYDEKHSSCPPGVISNAPCSPTTTHSQIRDNFSCHTAACAAAGTQSGSCPPDAESLVACNFSNAQDNNRQCDPVACTPPKTSELCAAGVLSDAVCNGNNTTDQGNTNPSNFKSVSPTTATGSQ